MQKVYISEKVIIEVYNCLKQRIEAKENCPSVWDMCYLIEAAHSYSSVQKALNELKRRKWIKPKTERINNVVQYEILKKD